jgi:membrane-bound lytic murein transglycosylase D
MWERIRKGFAMPDLDSPLVADRMQWYAARPDDLANMVNRSRKYLFYIVEEIERRQLPSELALLPFIESAYNPQAYSRAKAAGMWQFIPSTGKQYQLRQNAFRDDRRDVLASTRAALDYLERLHAMFGDWQLALAAYNWGEGSVSRAIAKNQRMGKPTGFNDLNMPNETRYYVPKLLGLKNVIANPARLGVTLPVIENHPYFDSVTITRDIDVALAAKLADVPLNDFRELNPSLHRPVILAGGSSQILLPWDNALVFKQNLDHYNSDRLATWTVWVAPTTMKPAEAARRVHMSEVDLKRVNAIPPNMLIRAGSSLLVPRPASQERDVAERIADNGQIALAPEMVLRKFTLRAGKRDSVAGVAKRYGLPAAKVAEWNHVGHNANFKPGQTIVVWRLVPAGGAPRVARR